MNYATKLTGVFVFLALLASAALAHAQARDAGSKITGNYGSFDQRARIRSAPVYRMPQSVVTRQSAEQSAQVAQQPASRAFSLDTSKQAPPCATAQPAPANQATRQPAPSQAVRRFSYDPGYAVPQRSYMRSRGWQGGARDAGSKVRGDY